VIEQDGPYLRGLDRLLQRARYEKGFMTIAQLEEHYKRVHEIIAKQNRDSAVAQNLVGRLLDRIEERRERGG
jgi:hypothetical protein